MVFFSADRKIRTLWVPRSCHISGTPLYFYHRIWPSTEDRVVSRLSPPFLGCQRTRWTDHTSVVVSLSSLYFFDRFYKVCLFVLFKGLWLGLLCLSILNILSQWTIFLRVVVVLFLRTCYTLKVVSLFFIIFHGLLLVSRVLVLTLFLNDHQI